MEGRNEGRQRKGKESTEQMEVKKKRRGKLRVDADSHLHDIRPFFGRGEL